MKDRACAMLGRAMRLPRTMPTLDRFCAVGMGAIRASGCAPFIVLVVLAGCGAKPSGITALRRQELLDQQPLSAWTELDAAHPGERLKDPRTGIVFRRIPAGEFVMGSSFITFAQPQHPVRISKPFLLAETELTLNQWRAFLADTGVPALAENWRGADALPAAIDHNGAALYCALYGYQIPTEAQWEWACLGGLSPSDPCWESADFCGNMRSITSMLATTRGPSHRCWPMATASTTCSATCGSGVLIGLRRMGQSRRLTRLARLRRLACHRLAAGVCCEAALGLPQHQHRCPRRGFGTSARRRLR